MKKIKEFILHYARLLTTATRISLRKSARQRGLMLRGILAWTIGSLILINAEISSFDTRFQIRGNQKPNDEIVLITITKQDMLRIHPAPILIAPQDVGEISDNYFWDPSLWSQLLKKILSANPATVGVTLFFGEPTLSANLNRDDKRIFFDPRVIWAAVSSQDEKIIPPAFSNKEHSNVGIVDIIRDQDGIIRHLPNHFQGSDSRSKLMIEKISHNNIEKEGTFSFINYKGDENIFLEIQAEDLLNNSESIKKLKNKIVLIGSEPIANSQYITPLGTTTRHAVLASMIDHLKNYRSIHHIHLIWYALCLAILTIMVAFVMSQYPQNVALVILVWISTLWTALSIWVFDSFYFWIPISSAIGTIGLTYFLLLGYQTNKIERKHYRLQQEQKYLQDLEQLKNNFVSLISHDLKTPIAKIQAILDRLMIREGSPELQTDLKSLRQSNEELNRYIQSVLRMLRVESRDFKLHIEVADINEVIQDVYKQLAPLAQEKNIFISLDLEPLFSSEFDQTLIREVVVNLVENAIKYTPRNGAIQIVSQEDKDHTLVTVQDSGEGIAETDLENIWGKFVRGKNQDLKTKGTGLGLYLVKFFIELHGGEVWIESKVGIGTKVCFTIPVEHMNNGVINENNT